MKAILLLSLLLALGSARGQDFKELKDKSNGMVFKNVWVIRMESPAVFVCVGEIDGDFDQWFLTEYQIGATEWAKAMGIIKKNAESARLAKVVPPQRPAPPRVVYVDRSVDDSGDMARARASLEAQRRHQEQMEEMRQIQSQMEIQRQEAFNNELMRATEERRKRDW